VSEGKEAGAGSHGIGVNDPDSLLQINGGLEYIAMSEGKEVVYRLKDGTTHTNIIQMVRHIVKQEIDERFGPAVSCPNCGDGKRHFKIRANPDCPHDDYAA
jgi:hypothetical protein